MDLATIRHQEAIRSTELELIIGELKSTDHVLEIGGGSGFQAAIMATHVASCVSLDTHPHPDSQYPVQLYDGVNIPFGDAAFDVIFSSNVLEHVHDFEGLMKSCTRVLKTDGTMYHIVPSPAWRIWTSLTHYPALPKLILGNLRNLMSKGSDKRTSPQSENQGSPPGDGANPPVQDRSMFLTVFRKFKLKWIRTIVISPRHGEHGNELTEALYFRSRFWRELFKKSGWRVIDERPTGLCYSGNALFAGSISVRMRQRLSHMLGSSTILFKVVRPSN